MRMRSRESLWGYLIGWSIIVFALGSIVYGSYTAYRWFNWKFGYEDKVIETIHREVKEECLKR